MSEQVERWMVDYEHAEGESQHAVLSWLSTDPTTGLPEAGTELVRYSDYEKLEAEFRSASRMVTEEADLVEKVEAERDQARSDYENEVGRLREERAPEIAERLHRMLTGELPKDKDFLVQAVNELAVAYGEQKHGRRRARAERDEELRERLKSEGMKTVMAHALFAGAPNNQERSGKFGESAIVSNRGIAETGAERVLEALADSIFEEGQ